MSISGEERISRGEVHNKKGIIYFLLSFKEEIKDLDVRVGKAPSQGKRVRLSKIERKEDE